MTGGVTIELQHTFKTLGEWIGELNFFLRPYFRAKLARFQQELSQIDISDEHLRPYYEKLERLAWSGMGTEIDTEYVYFFDEQLRFEYNVTDMLSSEPIKSKVNIYNARDLLSTENNFEMRSIDELLSDPSLGYYYQPLKNPILIMWMRPTNHNYILDGKHRLYYAYKKNLDVSVIIISSDDARQFLIAQEYRDLYDWMSRFIPFSKKLIGLHFSKSDADVES